jgi:hypothetical protein
MLVKFKNPHPGGIKGCPTPLPYAVKSTIDNLNGKEMDLTRAMGILKFAYSDGKFKAHHHKGFSFIVLKLTDGQGEHAWKVIEYEDSV